MHIPAPKAEWNINTIISVAGFALTLAGGVYAYGQLTSQVGFTASELASYKAATDVRLTGVETAVRQIDNLAYRMSAAENVNAGVSRALDDLQAAVSDQSGDIKLMREILQRIERQETPARYSPTAAIDDPR